jgi:hypothetical protein
MQGNADEERRAQRLQEIFQGLFLLALRKGAAIASVGIHGAAFAVTDGGRGWTRLAFQKEFPAWDLGRRLHELGCTEIQVVSRSRRGGWTTGLLPPMQLTTESDLQDVDLPVVTGTTVAFSLADPIGHPERIVQRARGVIDLRVRLDRRDVPRLHEMPQAWYRLRVEDPPGEFALNDALEGRTTVDSRGLCRPLGEQLPRSIFVPDDREASYEEGLRAASAALQARAASDLHRRPVLAPTEVAELMARHGGPSEGADPTRLVEFAMLLGYAAVITTGWEVSKKGVARTGFQLARLSRRTRAVEDLGREAAAIMGASGFDVTTSELAPDRYRRDLLRLTSLDHMPYLQQTLEAYSGDSTGVEALPCKEVAVGRLRLPWAIITPQVRRFQADGEDLGEGPWGFVALEAGEPEQACRHLWESPQLLQAFGWLMTQWDHDQLDWCLYRDAQGRWCLNQDRVRVVLYETLTRVARWETPEKEFAQRARALEEQLDPALNRLTAVAPAFASDLRDPLLSLAPHIAELEAARSDLWRPSR